jgi:cation diffusion facilitator CzcD-associated flavoprotein CzcO
MTAESGVPRTTAEREALNERYRAERDKRVRADGNDQYIEVVGEFARFVDDPYVTAEPRAARHDEVTFAFVGGGFAGLTAGAYLAKAGVVDVRLVEKGGDVGGTWYWNRYPGAQCDTTSFVYMPLLEEVGHMPTEKYARGPEILAHCRNIATHFSLYDNALLSTEVTAMEWNAQSKQWVLTTNRGDVFRARFVAMGTGALHRPKLPGIEGINDFRGKMFHTSRWDYSYTGGDATGSPMTLLADKRVGIIGTGATGVQCVPHLARACQQLFVFQRTPSSVDVRNNHPIEAAWFSQLAPGWQDEWLMNFTTVQSGGNSDVDLVMDGWGDITKRIRAKLLAHPNPDFSPAGRIRAYHESDDEKMTEIRSRIDSIVDDPVTAEALKPWYRQGCKRPCFHDEYLNAFNHPSTRLVDTDGKGVDRITATGAVVAGVEYQLDCLIFATGFEVGTEHHRRSGVDPIGRDGQLLSTKWANGMRTLHGMHINGFPNLFFVSPSQAANLLSNVPHNLIEAGRTIAAIVKHALEHNATEVEATLEAEDAWVELLQKGGNRFGDQHDCTPGYYNNEGAGASAAGVLNTLGYPDGPVAYFSYITDWRSTGEFTGLNFRP